MTAHWFVGGEDRYYDAPVLHEVGCVCTEAGLLDCFCGGPVTLDDARDWLDEHTSLDPWVLDAVEVILQVEDMHPDGWTGFYEECAAGKALHLLRLRTAFMGEAA